MCYKIKELIRFPVCKCRQIACYSDHQGKRDGYVGLKLFQFAFLYFIEAVFYMLVVQ